MSNADDRPLLTRFGTRVGDFCCEPTRPSIRRRGKLLLFSKWVVHETARVYR
jgi:hypothetical protein